MSASAHIDPTAMCMCFVVGGSLDAPRGVLLGHKRRGLGTGNIVALGGHIDSGETPAAAAAREVAEESGLRVDEPDLHQHADVAGTRTCCGAGRGTRSAAGRWSVVTWASVTHLAASPNPYLRQPEMVSGRRAA
jgi:8-oxo-dGTP pyrophosphatase MutT (NUDIX family)